jgi:hypothetical protein
MMRRLSALPALIFALTLPLAAPAEAQIQLPGAVSPGASAGGKSGGGGVLSLSPGKSVRKKSSGGGAALGKPPGEDAIAGRPLFLNGGAGKLEFARQDKALQIKSLVFGGEQAAKPGEACEVNVALSAPLAAKPAGQPAGLLRYDVEFAACPFSFDILDDAVLVTSANLTCEFKEAACQVSPAGLWGPKAASFTPDKAKEIERARTRWEAAARASFRDATARASDKNEIQQIARRQSSFSSERETQCRDYAGEDNFGYCAARLTEAHAFALRARTAQAAGEQAAARDEKKKKK